MSRFYLDTDKIYLSDGVVKDSLILSQAPSRLYDRSRREYCVPATRECLAFILQRFPDADVSADIFEYVARNEAIISSASVARESLSDAILPVNGTPYQHQKQAFSMCMKLYGVMIP